MDQFYLIADRYHFHLLALIQTEDFKNDLKWMAKRLGISVVQVRTALDRLERLGLITKDKTDLRLSSTKGISTSHDVSSGALRKSHHQALDRATLSLDQDPVEIRDFSSITMAIDQKKIPEAKRMIKEFRRRLCKFMETGKSGEVYELNIQLVPVTKFQLQKENV